MTIINAKPGLTSIGVLNVKELGIYHADFTWVESPVDDNNFC